MKDLIQLYKRVEVRGGTTTRPVGRTKIHAMNKEVSLLGYTLGVDVMNALGRISPENFRVFRSNLLTELVEISGAGNRHQTLFRNFPHETPDQSEYLEKRIVSFFQNDGFIPNTKFQYLSCGHVVDERLFPDLKQFGACPICQFQVDELPYDPPAERTKYDRITHLQVLHVANTQFLQKAGSALLARNASLSTQERAFLSSVLNREEITLDPPEKVFRENLPFVYEAFNGNVRDYMKSATDVMRIAYYLSDKESDLSLTENVKFKLTTSHKKKLLNLLDMKGDITEDLMRNRERWLRFGEHVHIGSSWVRRQHPAVWNAFQTLRNDSHAISTFNRTLEQAVRSKDISRPLVKLVASRPGEFLRKLDVLLRTAKTPGTVIHQLTEVAKASPTKLLLEVYKYLGHRKIANGNRMFLPKGKSNKMKIVEDHRSKIPVFVLDQAQKRISDVLVERFGELPEMGKVYLDPSLSGMILPYNQRGDSKKTVAMSKGTRYALNDSPVYRMFTHWEGAFDVDLSAIFYNDKYEFVNHIGFTNLSGGGVLHSGDVQNAPEGASEFIDIDVGRVRKTKVRYVAMVVISYRGNGFNEFPCYAGIMERDALRSGKQFEPSSVKIKFDLTAETNSYMPIILDLETNEIIFADVNTRGGSFGEVSSQNTKFATIMKGVLEMTQRKPTAMDILDLHVKARGVRVDHPDKADRVFDSSSTVQEIADSYLV